MLETLLWNLTGIIGVVIITKAVFWLVSLLQNKSRKIIIWSAIAGGIAGFWGVFSIVFILAEYFTQLPIISNIFFSSSIPGVTAKHCIIIAKFIIGGLWAGGMIGYILNKWLPTKAVIASSLIMAMLLMIQPHIYRWTCLYVPSYYQGVIQYYFWSPPALSKDSVFYSDESLP